MSTMNEIKKMDSEGLLDKCVKLIEINAVQRYLARYDKNIETEIQVMLYDLRKRLAWRQKGIPKIKGEENEV